MFLVIGEKVGSARDRKDYSGRTWAGVLLAYGAYLAARLGVLGGKQEVRTMVLLGLCVVLAAVCVPTAFNLRKAVTRWFQGVPAMSGVAVALCGVVVVFGGVHWDTAWQSLAIAAGVGVVVGFIFHITRWFRAR